MAFISSYLSDRSKRDQADAYKAQVYTVQFATGSAPATWLLK